MGRAIGALRRRVVADALQAGAGAEHGKRVPRHRPVTLAGDVPISVDGERSRVISGDATAYSVVDSPKPLVA